MGGRIYDPTLGRFLQADPFIQSPKNSQSYNRFAYVFNNPMSNTDPSGFISLKGVLGGLIGTKVLGALAKVPILNTAVQIGIGIACQGAAAACLAAYNGLQTFAVTGSLGAGIRSAAISYASSQAFQSIGENFQGKGGFFDAGVKNGFNHIAAHAATGGVIAVAQGGKFGHGFFSAGITKGLTPQFEGIGGSNFEVNGYNFAEAAIAGTLGGTISRLTGGKFANGAVTAAMGNLFNNQRNREDASKERILDKDTNICSSTCKTLTTSIGGGLAIISGEGGTLYVYDPKTGLVHVFDYAAGGLGLGLGVAVSGELGKLSPTSIGDLSGWGLGVSGFAAAYHGASGQIYGSSYFNDSGTIGGGVGYAFGAGFGVSGILTRTWYRSSAELSSLSELEGAF